MTGEATQNPLYFQFFPDENSLTNDPTNVSASLSEVGGKGLSLIQASKNGFPVPKGFVLSVDFFQPWIELCLDESKSKAWKIFAEKARTVQQQKEESKTAITKDDCDALKTECSKKLAVGKKGCYFTPNQEKALQDAIQGVFGGNESGDGAIVAVRSSSPEEDLVGTSFAGGYETTLGVPLNTSSTGNKNDAFVKALLDSFLSMLDYRVVQYKLQQQQKVQNKNDGDVIMDVLKPKIAVVVQEQIDSQTSGVAFSINPHNNCYDEIVITANFGLGESVVSGIVTPDVYTVEHCKDDEFVILDTKIGAKKEVIWLEKKKDEKGTVQRSSEDASKEAALSESQIVELAKMVAKVEDFYSRESALFCPIDVEWAYHNETLYLLQARPVTSYIPLFPEMITPRGAAKKNVFVDVIVMTQGFSEPFSVLGLDVWSIMVGEMKSEFKKTGPTCPMWNIHGRQYMNISNYLKTTGGTSFVEKIKEADPATDRAFDSIDLDDYTPVEIPDGVHGYLWGKLKTVFRLVPSLILGLWLGEKALDKYKEFAEDFIVNKDAYMPDSSFRSFVKDSAVLMTDQMFSYLGIMATVLWSKSRLATMFKDCKEKGTDDLLVSLYMDLKGNPTSEMGHAMVGLAVRPEIAETKTAEEFRRKIDEEIYSEEFMGLYKDFMMRYGCRGMKEIDMATPRTSEDPGVLFEKVKQIDPEKNAILQVTKRRRDAVEKLSEIARDLGKEKDFLYYEKFIHNFWGYREHPKYMIVVMLARCRERALILGEKFVSDGRMDSKDQVFDLTFDQVASAEEGIAPQDLRPWIEGNTHPIKLVEHVKNWPTVIDSRGKIIRGTRKRPKSEGGDENNSLLLGDPIAPGTVTGRAKVLLAPYEKPLESGEILVARFTEPSWTPIFINAAAVVMEIGGPLQHGAIIAREYGIPCVSGLDGATAKIKDGDLIKVDGSSGTVTFIEKVGSDEKKIAEESE